VIRLVAFGDMPRTRADVAAVAEIEDELVAKNELDDEGRHSRWFYGPFFFAIHGLCFMHTGMPRYGKGVRKTETRECARREGGRSDDPDCQKNRNT